MNNIFKDTLQSATYITETIKAYDYFTNDYKLIQDFGVNELARAKNLAVIFENVMDTDLKLKVSNLGGTEYEITIFADRLIALDNFKIIGSIYGKVEGTLPTEGKFKIWSW